MNHSSCASAHVNPSRFAIRYETATGAVHLGPVFGGDPAGEYADRLLKVIAAFPGVRAVRIVAEPELSAILTGKAVA